GTVRRGWGNPRGGGRRGPAALGARAGTPLLTSGRANTILSIPRRCERTATARGTTRAPGSTAAPVESMAPTAELDLERDTTRRLELTREVRWLGVRMEREARRRFGIPALGRTPRRARVQGCTGAGVLRR